MGQQVKFEWKSNLAAGTTLSSTAVYVNLRDNVPTYLSAYSIKRNFIINRGAVNEEPFAANFTTNGANYGEIYTQTPLTKIHNAGEPIEDLDAISIGPLTIQSVIGKNVTFVTQFTKTRIPGDPLVPATGAAAQTAKFKVVSASIAQQNGGDRKNNRRVVIQQTGYFVNNAGVRLLDYIDAKIYYYFYADSPVIRVRTVLYNRTLDSTQVIVPTDQNFVSLKYIVPTAITTASINRVTTLVEAKSTYSDTNVNLLSKSILADNSLQMSVPEFAPKFPKGLVANSTGLTFEILPATGTNHTLFKSHANVDDFYLGINAQNYMPLTTEPQLSLDPTYVIATKAIRQVLPSKRTYTASQFTPVGVVTAAEMAEAANRWQTMLETSYDKTVPASDTYNYGQLGKQNVLSIRIAGFDNRPHEDLGWQIYGNHAWDQGYSYNHYDTGFHALVGFLRAGNSVNQEIIAKQAFRVASETARYMSTYGMFQSQNKSQVDWNQYGMNHFESSLLSTNIIAKPTHTWSESLWLHWAFTGDDVVYEACIAHKTAATQYTPATYNFLNYNEGRWVGWSILEATTAYRYLGDPTLLTQAGSYVTWLIGKEQSQCQRSPENE